MKLSNKITLWTIAAMAVTIPALITTIFYSAKGILKRNIEKTQIQIARNTMDTIDRLLEDACEDIRTASGMDSIEQCLAGLSNRGKSKGNPQDAPNSAALKKTIEAALEKSMLLSNHWYTLDVVDVSGNVIASSYPREASVKPSMLPEYKLAYTHAIRGKQYYSDLVISQRLGKPTVIFSAPIWNSGETGKNKVIGAVIGNYAWAVVTDLIESLPAETNAQLFNRDGRLIAGRACNRSLILEKSLADVEPVKKTLEGMRRSSSSSSSYASGCEKFEYVYGVAVQQKGLHGYKGCRWGLLLETSQSHVVKPIVQMSRNMTFLAFASSAFFVIAIIFVMKRLTAPIKELTDAAEALGRGNYSVKIAVRSSDEIGILSDTFNRMAENIASHVNERKQREALLQRQAQMLDLASDAIIIHDFDNRITYWNHAAVSQYGWTATEAIGQYPNELLNAVFPVTEDEVIAALFRDGSWEGEVTQTRRNGSQITVWSRFKLLKDEKDSLVGMLEINRDITEKKVAEETIRNLSLTDELTQLYNRRGFMTFTQQALRIAERTKNAATIFFADVDGLKWINDNLGHDHGDMVILDAASVLRNTFRESDIIARLGGDEFAVVAMGDPSFSASALAARLQENIEAHNAHGGRQFRLSMSVGMVRQAFTQPKSIDDLLKEADGLMYEQKRKKKEKMKVVDYRKRMKDEG